MNEQFPSVFESEVEPSVIQDCGTKESSFHLIRYKIVPNPPVKGEVVYLKVEGELKEAVTEGTLKMKVRFGALKLIDIETDLCEFAASHHAYLPECPISSGKIYYANGFKVPSELPPGKVTFKVNAEKSNGVSIFCLKGNIEFIKK